MRVNIRPTSGWPSLLSTNTQLRALAIFADLSWSNETGHPFNRSIVSMLQEDGKQMGRFKVRGPMRELELVSKQPGSHAYKQATVERPDIPNILNREFDVPAPNQAWYDDIIYIIWAQGK